ncbi:hypothetical protein BZA70DRAFT_272257 [Myxozyma melibiosi]|uniref:Shugoshin C-terminal domain-containing protein n=1 Tax=Myxozyma melibiosi TaxID=54550 RepID=A0ABR1FD81_9ASCO
MARLAADPAVLAETIDSIKRRFLRQNRELARVNSSHSTRISNLESKIAELLAENLDLRQQVIALEQNRERWITHQCQEVRERLQAKVREMEDTLELFAATAKSSIYATPPERGATMVSTMQAEEQATGYTDAFMMNVSTRKKLSPRDTALTEADEQTAEDENVEDMPLPEPVELHRTTAEEMLQEEIPEIPESDMVSELISSSTVPGREVNRSRRKRRDSLQELDIINIVKAQNTNYKSKLSANKSTSGAQQSSTMAEADVEESIEPEVVTEPAPAETEIIDRTITAASDQVEELKPAARRESRARRRSSMLIASTSPPQLAPEKPSGITSRSSRRSSIIVSRDPPAFTTDDSIEDKTLGSSAEVNARSSEKADVVEAEPKKAEPKVERRVLQNKNVNLEPITTKSTALKKMKDDALPLAEKDKLTGDESEVIAKKSISESKVQEDVQRESVSPEGGRRPSRRARSSINYALPSLRVKMRRETEQFLDAVVITSERTVERRDSGIPADLGASKAGVRVKEEKQDDAVDMSSIPISEPPSLELGKRKRKSSVWSAAEVEEKPSTTAKPSTTRRRASSAMTSSTFGGEIEPEKKDNSEGDIYAFVDGQIEHIRKPRTSSDRKSMGDAGRRASVASSMASSAKDKRADTSGLGSSGGTIGGKRRRSVAV